MNVKSEQTHGWGIKLTAFAVVFVFTITSVTWTTPVAAASADVTAPAVFPINSLTIPAEMGTIARIWMADGGGRVTKDEKPAPSSIHHPPSDRFVVLIQDAHAVIDAQQNIAKILGHLQKNYGVSLIALEGAKSRLEPVLLRTFPDAGVKRKILAGYEKRAELSGPEVAAVLLEKAGDYRGMEDWRLYEKNYFAYLRAQENKAAQLSRWSAFKQTLDDERAKVYEPALNEFEEIREDFLAERISLLDLLFYVSKFKDLLRADSGYQELPGLIESIGYEKSGKSGALAPLVRTIADEFKAKYLRGLGVKTEMNFYNRYQAFMTGQITPGQMLQYLVDLGNECGKAVKLSPALKRMLGHAEVLSEIKGSRLGDELQRFLAQVEASLIKTQAERELSGKYRKLFLLKEMISLELTHEDFAEYQKEPDAYLDLVAEPAFKKDLEPSLEFYHAALERDQAFMAKIDEMMTDSKQKTLAVVAGGFHTQGLERLLKEKSVAYAVVAPKIASLAGNENYAKVMKGDVSFKDGLKTTYFDALMRCAAKALVEALPIQDRVMTLKVWRDNVVREFAAQGRIAEVGECLPYIDEVLQGMPEAVTAINPKRTQEEILDVVRKELERFKKESFGRIWKTFEFQLDIFTNGLKQLIARKDLNTQTVSALLDRASQSQPSFVALIQSLDPTIRVMRPLALPGVESPTAVTARPPALPAVAPRAPVAEVSSPAPSTESKGKKQDAIRQPQVVSPGEVGRSEVRAGAKVRALIMAGMLLFSAFFISIDAAYSPAIAAGDRISAMASLPMDVRKFLLKGLDREAILEKAERREAELEQTGKEVTRKNVSEDLTRIIDKVYAELPENERHAMHNLAMYIMQIESGFENMVQRRKVGKSLEPVLVGVGLGQVELATVKETLSLYLKYDFREDHFLYKIHEAEKSFVDECLRRSANITLEQLINSFSRTDPEVLRLALARPMLDNEFAIIMVLIKMDRLRLDLKSGRRVAARGETSFAEFNDAKPNFYKLYRGGRHETPEQRLLRAELNVEKHQKPVVVENEQAALEGLSAQAKKEVPAKQSVAEIAPAKTAVVEKIPATREGSLSSGEKQEASGAKTAPAVSATEKSASYVKAWQWFILGFLVGIPLTIFSVIWLLERLPSRKSSIRPRQEYGEISYSGNRSQRRTVSVVPKTSQYLGTSYGSRNTGGVLGPVKSLMRWFEKRFARKGYRTPGNQRPRHGGRSEVRSSPKTEETSRRSEMRQEEVPQTGEMETDPWGTSYAGKKSLLNALKTHPVSEFSKVFFSMGDVDKIGAMNLVLGKYLVGVMGEAKSLDLLFPPKVSPFLEFRKELKTILQKYDAEIYRGAGGDEFMLSAGERFNARDLDNVVQELTQAFRERYLVVRINRPLGPEEVDYLKKEEHMLAAMNFGRGVNVLVDRRRLGEQSVPEFLEHLGWRFNLGEREYGSVEFENRVRGFFSVSIGGVPADNALEYLIAMMSETLGKEAGRAFWIEKRKILEPQGGFREEDFLRNDRLELFLTWGMRLANDALSFAKDTGRNRSVRLPSLVIPKNQDTYVKQPMTAAKIETEQEQIQERRNSSQIESPGDKDPLTELLNETAGRAILTAGHGGMPERNEIGVIEEFTVPSYGEKDGVQRPRTRAFHRLQNLIGYYEGGDKVIKSLGRLARKVFGINSEEPVKETLRKGIIPFRESPDKIWVAFTKGALASRGPPVTTGELDSFALELGKTVASLGVTYQTPPMVMLTRIEDKELKLLNGGKESPFDSLLSAQDVMSILEWEWVRDAIKTVKIKEKTELDEIVDVEWGEHSVILTFNHQKAKELLKRYRESQEKTGLATLKEELNGSFVTYAELVEREARSEVREELRSLSMVLGSDQKSGRVWEKWVMIGLVTLSLSGVWNLYDSFTSLAISATTEQSDLLTVSSGKRLEQVKEALTGKRVSSRAIVAQAKTIEKELKDLGSDKTKEMVSEDLVRMIRAVRGELSAKDQDALHNILMHLFMVESEFRSVLQRNSKGKPAFIGGVGFGQVGYRTAVNTLLKYVERDAEPDPEELSFVTECFGLSSSEELMELLRDLKVFYEKPKNKPVLHRNLVYFLMRSGHRSKTFSLFQFVAMLKLLQGVPSGKNLSDFVYDPTGGAKDTQNKNLLGLYAGHYIGDLDKTADAFKKLQKTYEAISQDWRDSGREALASLPDEAEEKETSGEEIVGGESVAEVDSADVFAPKTGETVPTWPWMTLGGVVMAFVLYLVGLRLWVWKTLFGKTIDPSQGEEPERAKVDPEDRRSEVRSEQSLEEIIGKIRPRGSEISFIDLDAGLGDFIPAFSEFLTNKLGYRVKSARGTEMFSHLIHQAPVFLQSQITHGNAQIPKDLSELPQHAFDIVTINHIESAPEALAKRAQELLTNGGVLLVTIEANDAIDGLEPGIVWAIQSAGFDVQAMDKPKDYPQYQTLFESKKLLVAVPKGRSEVRSAKEVLTWPKWIDPQSKTLIAGMTFYDVFKVPQDASPESIKRSYRKLAKQYHPDHCPDKAMGESVFKVVSQAYEVLSDQEKREQYDLAGRSEIDNFGWEDAVIFGGPYVDALRERYNREMEQAITELKQRGMLAHGEMGRQRIRDVYWVGGKIHLSVNGDPMLPRAVSIDPSQVEHLAFDVQTHFIWRDGSNILTPRPGHPGQYLSGGNAIVDMTRSTEHSFEIDTEDVSGRLARLADETKRLQVEVVPVPGTKGVLLFSDGVHRQDWTYSFTPDGSHLIYFSSRGDVIDWNIESGTFETWEIPFKNSKSKAQEDGYARVWPIFIPQVKPSPDGSMALVWYQHGYGEGMKDSGEFSDKNNKRPVVEIWDAKQKEMVARRFLDRTERESPVTVEWDASTLNVVVFYAQEDHGSEKGFLWDWADVSDPELVAAPDRAPSYARKQSTTVPGPGGRHSAGTNEHGVFQVTSSDGKNIPYKVMMAFRIYFSRFELFAPKLPEDMEGVQVTWSPGGTQLIAVHKDTVYVVQPDIAQTSRLHEGPSAAPLPDTTELVPVSKPSVPVTQRDFYDRALSWHLQTGIGEAFMDYGSLGLDGTGLVEAVRRYPDRIVEVIRRFDELFRKKERNAREERSLDRLAFILPVLVQMTPFLGSQNEQTKIDEIRKFVDVDTLIDCLSLDCDPAGTYWVSSQTLDAILLKLNDLAMMGDASAIEKARGRLIRLLFPAPDGESKYGFSSYIKRYDHNLTIALAELLFFFVNRDRLGENPVLDSLIRYERSFPRGSWDVAWSVLDWIKRELEKPLLADSSPQRATRSEMRGETITNSRGESFGVVYERANRDAGGELQDPRDWRIHEQDGERKAYWDRIAKMDLGELGDAIKGMLSRVSETGRVVPLNDEALLQLRGEEFLKGFVDHLSEPGQLDHYVGYAHPSGGMLLKMVQALPAPQRLELDQFAMALREVALRWSDVAFDPRLGKVEDVKQLGLSSGQLRTLAKQLYELSTRCYTQKEQKGMSVGEWQDILKDPYQSVYILRDLSGAIAGAAVGGSPFIWEGKKGVWLDRLMSRDDDVQGKGTFLLDVFLSHMFLQDVRLFRWNVSRFSEDFYLHEEKGYLRPREGAGILRRLEHDPARRVTPEADVEIELLQNPLDRRFDKTLRDVVGLRRSEVRFEVPEGITPITEHPLLGKVFDVRGLVERDRTMLLPLAGELSALELISFPGEPDVGNRKEWEDRLRDPNQYVYVMMSPSGEILGTVWGFFIPLQNDRARLAQVMTRDNGLRGKATLLVDVFFRELFVKGARSFELYAVGKGQKFFADYFKPRSKKKIFKPSKNGNSYDVSLPENFLTFESDPRHSFARKAKGRAEVRLEIPEGTHLIAHDDRIGTVVNAKTLLDLDRKQLPRLAKRLYNLELSRGFAKGETKEEQMDSISEWEKQLEELPSDVLVLVRSNGDIGGLVRVRDIVVDGEKGVEMELLLTSPKGTPGTGTLLFFAFLSYLWKKDVKLIRWNTTYDADLKFYLKRLKHWQALNILTFVRDKLSYKVRLLQDPLNEKLSALQVPEGEGRSEVRFKVPEGAPFLMSHRTLGGVVDAKECLTRAPDQLEPLVERLDELDEQSFTWFEFDFAAYHWDEYLEDKFWRVYLHIDLTGDVVGAAAVHLIDAQTAQLEALMNSPGDLKGGGQFLVDIVVEQMRKEGIKTLKVETTGGEEVQFYQDYLEPRRLKGILDFREQDSNYTLTLINSPFDPKFVTESGELDTEPDELRKFWGTQRSEMRDENLINPYVAEGNVSRELSVLDQAYGISAELSKRQGPQQMLLIGVGRGFAAIELALKFSNVKIVAVNKESGLWNDPVIEAGMLKKGYAIEDVRAARQRIELKEGLDIENEKARTEQLGEQVFDFVVFETMTQIYLRDKVKVIQDLFNQKLKMGGVYAISLSRIFASRYALSDGALEWDDENQREEGGTVPTIWGAFGKSGKMAHVDFNEGRRNLTYIKTGDLNIPLIFVTAREEDLGGMFAWESFYRQIPRSDPDARSEMRFEIPAGVPIRAEHPLLGKVVNTWALLTHAPEQLKPLARKIYDLELLRYSGEWKEEDLRKWEEMLRDPRQYIQVLISSSGDVVGATRSHRRPLEEGKGERLYRIMSIKDEMRGRGTLLMDAFLDAMLERGMTIIDLYLLYGAEDFWASYFKPREEKGALKINTQTVRYYNFDLVESPLKFGDLREHLGTQRPEVGGDTGQKEIWRKSFAKELKEPVIKKEYEVTPSAKALVEGGTLPQGAKILDIGSWMGHDALYFARNGFDVTATDFIEEPLEYLLETAQSEGVQARIHTQLLDLQKPVELPADAYDVIFAHLSMHYVDDARLKQRLVELWRSLKTGGRITLVGRSVADGKYVSAKQREGVFVVEGNGKRQRFFEERSMKEFLADVFQDISFREIPPYERYVNQGLSHMLEVTITKRETDGAAQAVLAVQRSEARIDQNPLKVVAGPDISYLAQMASNPDAVRGWFLKQGRSELGKKIESKVERLREELGRYSTAQELISFIRSPGFQERVTALLGEFGDVAELVFLIRNRVVFGDEPLSIERLADNASQLDLGKIASAQALLDAAAAGLLMDRKEPSFVLLMDRPGDSIAEEVLAMLATLKPSQLIVYNAAKEKPFGRAWQNKLKIPIMPVGNEGSVRRAVKASSDLVVSFWTQDRGMDDLGIYSVLAEIGRIADPRLRALALTAVRVAILRFATLDKETQSKILAEPSTIRSYLEQFGIPAFIQFNAKGLVFNIERLVEAYTARQAVEKAA